jgi:D-alanyl-D-alanine carboxypeptidase
MTVLLSYLRNLRFTWRIARLHRKLGIPAGYAQRRGLPLQPEARRLVSVGPDIYQRDQRLLPAAAAAWQAMASAAAADGVELQLVSAFRPVDYQAGILRRKLDQGQSIDDILRVSAAPGYSEHHSGRAVDLTTPGCAVLEEEFEHSAAFAWLNRRALEFGFRLSYPRGNPHGVAFEPWHWAWSESARGL